MSISRTDKEPLQAELLVTIPKGQYVPKLDSELKKYQQKVQMKGFRKGKVPMSVIRKMYGKAVLADVVNEQVQSELSGYFEAEKLDILGQPLPSADQRNYDFGLKNLEDFEFKFEIGLAPEFDLKGVSKETTFEKPVAIVSEQMIDDELLLARKRKGSDVHPDQDFTETDVLTIQAEEVREDEEPPHQTEFKIMISRIADQDLSDRVLSGKKGDELDFDIFRLEKEASDQYVRKYFLNLQEDELEKEVGARFKGSITDITRIEPAPLDKDFFDAYFGEGNVSTVEEARNNIKEDIAAYYNRQSEALMFRDFQEKLLELHQIELPHDFLKRWLIEGNKDLDGATMEKEYDAFARNLVWTLIENKVKNQFDLKVEPDEVKEVLRARVMQYMGSYQFTPDMLDQTVNRLMGDQDQVRKAYEEKMSDKIFETILAEVTIKEKELDLEAFNKLVAEARQKANPNVHDEEE